MKIKLFEGIHIVVEKEELSLIELETLTGIAKTANKYATPVEVATVQVAKASSRKYVVIPKEEKIRLLNKHKGNPKLVAEESGTDVKSVYTWRNVLKGEFEDDYEINRSISERMKK